MTADIKQYPVALFKVNRQISNEARSMFYGRQNFTFQLPSFFEAFAKSVGKNMKLVRNVEIFWVGCYDPERSESRYTLALKRAGKSYQSATMDSRRIRPLRDVDYIANVLPRLPGPRTLPNFKIHFLDMEDGTALRKLQLPMRKTLVAAAQHISVETFPFDCRDTERMCSLITYHSNLETLSIKGIDRSLGEWSGNHLAELLVSHLGDWFRGVSRNRSALALFTNLFLLTDELFLLPSKWYAPILKYRGSVKIACIDIVKEVERRLGLRVSESP